MRVCNVEGILTRHSIRYITFLNIGLFAGKDNVKQNLLALLFFLIILTTGGLLLFNYYYWYAIFSCPEKSLVVVIPSYNNAAWYKKNLDSVFGQRYTNYRIIYIDDCSTDQTGDLVNVYVKAMHQDHRVTIIRNHCQRGVLANLVHAIGTCDDHEIVIDLDGDDWLKDNRVFKRVNAIYQDPDVWLTYGQYETYPVGNKGICKQLPDWVIEQQAYRTYPWITSHLRTFYAGLFKLIKIEDCQYNNDFYRVGNDQLFMFCMLEMAGYHSRFVPEVLYVYNVMNALNEFRIHHNQEKPIIAHTRSKRTYAPLPDDYVWCAVH